MKKQRNSWIEYPILGILVVGAFLLRVVGQWDKVFVDGNVWFRGVDSWYHMRLVDNMLVNFPVPIKWDMFATYPDGYSVGYFPLMSWMIAIPGKFLDYEAVGALLPPILGALTLIPVYYIGKALFSKGVGLLACLLVAILPTEFFHRTLLGFTDHHVLEVFFSTFTILFLILAYKNIKKEKVKWLYPILAGVSLGLYLSSWLGGLLLVLPIWIWFIITFTYKLFKGQPIEAFYKVTTVVFVIALLLFIPNFFLVQISIPLLLLMLGATATPYIFYLLSRILKDWKTFTIVTEGVLIVLIIFLGSFFPALFNYPRSVFFGIGATIEEAAPITPTVLFNQYGISFFLFLGGLYYAIKNKTNSLFLIWTLIIFLTTIGQRRWGYYFVINNALLAAYFTFMLGKWVKPNVRVAVIVVVCFFMVLPTLKGTVGLASRPNNIDNDWYHACLYLKENTPNPFLSENAYYELENKEADYGVLSWWDYGHWIIRIGHRVPVTSPTWQDSPLQSRVLVAQSEEEANKFLEGINIKYIIVDEAMVTGKFYALAQKAGVPNTEDIRKNSMVMRLWNEEVETWRKIYQVGRVKIFERSNG